jgi:predicted N-acetyltransferase YhbS
MQIRLGTPADFPLVMDRVATSFRAGNPGHLPFEDLYPDSVTPEAMPEWRLAFAGDELAGGIQLVPRSLRLAGMVDLPAMGLGNVFCYPACRGQGVMSALLERCIADMREQGTAICLLGGDRTRYGHFGWEHCGAQLRLSLSRHVKRHDAFTPASVLDLRVWSGAPRDTERMAAAYHALPYHCARPEGHFAPVLRRPGQVVWLCDDPELGFAYASVRGRDLLEYAGPPAACERILHFLLANGELNASLPSREHAGELEELLLDYARSFSVSPTGMGRIVCLVTLLEAYLPLLAERLQGWAGTLSLGCTDGEGAILRSSEAGLAVEPCAPDACDIVLSRNDLALLLFGPIPPKLGPSPRLPVLRQAFPLPLFWHPLAHV